MATYTTRQTEILQKLGRTMGFTVDQVTAITLEADIPVTVTYSNNRGVFTRDTTDQLAQIITDSERNAMLSQRLTNRESDNFLNYQSLFAINARPQTTDFVTSSGRADSQTTTGSMSFDPKENRLSAAGLANAAKTAYLENAARTQVKAGQNEESRVRISDPSGIFIAENNPVLAPLRKSGNMVIFPYAPSISVTHQANYEDVNLTHSNYSYLFYQNSPTATINITATFTAKDAESASYVVAVQHFFRSVTKMFYGKDDIAGIPPPVLRLDGYGPYQFSSVPVVVKSFGINLPTDVDYITSEINTNTKVPTSQEFAIELAPLYSRRSISNNFSLKEFAAGRLLATKNGRGGFI